MKLGHFGKQIRNAWTVLKCGAAKGWISWTDGVRNEVLRGIKVERNIIREIKRRLTRLDTSGVGIAF